MRTQRNLYLAVAAFATYVVAWLMFAAPMDQVYWNARYFLSGRQAPQSVVVVRLDPGEGRPDQSADTSAQVLRALRPTAPRHVYLDAGIRTATPRLTAELEQWGGGVSLVARQMQGYITSDAVSARNVELPHGPWPASVDVVVSGFVPNFWKYATHAPCAFQFDGKTYRSLGASIAGVSCVAGDIRPDFSINPSSIPMLDAAAIIEGGVDPTQFAGKTVILSVATDNRRGILGYFGHRQQPLVAFDIAAAAGARRQPVEHWKFPALLILFTLIAAVAQRMRHTGLRWTGYALAATIALGGPVALESAGQLVQAGGTAVVMAVFAAWRLWSRWRRRVIETGNSGLPNFVALGNQKIPAGFNIVVAVIGRYEEFLATLPTDLHAECARQIARRFSVGCGTAEVYHGDGGHFAWIEQDRDADNQIEHFEGMRALFSAPLLVGGHMFDTNVHFGIDRNGQFDTLTRLNTALASAADALRHGRTIEQFEANRLANAPWELSLLARIDEGMRNGDIWLAYQPQWDYAENRISGAEALVRWNDPVRGPIRPDEFILQAERAGRIDALTYWVLEQAITSAELFNAHGPRFQMSVNLSAQLVDKPSLVSATAEIVRRRGIDCRLLTIEVTETASVYNRPGAIRNLRELQAMGFRLSIDDFGTGEASLCYLADLPSDELKLDRRFVSKIVECDRERKIVHSTINLAHALGQTVVAEGIEDVATFDMLRHMGCDVAQGYYVGRPETLEQLRARYMSLGMTGVRTFTSC